MLNVKLVVHHVTSRLSKLNESLPCCQEDRLFTGQENSNNSAPQIHPCTIIWVRFDWRYKFCAKHCSLLEVFCEIITLLYIYRSECTVPVCFADFNESGIFSTDFRKILQYTISLKPALSAKLFPADRHEVHIPFSQFCQRFYP